MAHSVNIRKPTMSPLVEVERKIFDVAGGQPGALIAVPGHMNHRRDCHVRSPFGPKPSDLSCTLEFTKTTYMLISISEISFCHDRMEADMSIFFLIPDENSLFRRNNSLLPGQTGSSLNVFDIIRFFSSKSGHGGAASGSFQDFIFCALRGPRLRGDDSKALARAVSMRPGTALSPSA
jgi:hypothetical protein